ncbi:MAG: DUF134 domain-containing protein [Bacteroidales bacterium]|nr:DUF134 domain-containing protein [Bacteroidales bacterium]
MSPRRKRMRKIFGPPAIKSLQPRRRGGGSISSEPVILLLEEYESIKLCDYDLMTHQEASEIMGVSRPTFTRIYASARRKVALSLVEIRTVLIEGGKVFYDGEWCECNDCGCTFNHTATNSQPEICPLCGSKNVKTCLPASANKNLCECPNCNAKFTILEDANYVNKLCPICGTEISKCTPK